MVRSRSHQCDNKIPTPKFMRDLENRKDVELLVLSFYAQIRKDELLGPIFNGTIPKEKWPEHLDKLADFWETNIWGIPKFNGNPVLAHARVDTSFHHSISQDHFSHWLELWFSTVDSLFVGEKAMFIKNRAQNMATGQFLKILQLRPKEI